MTIKDKINSIVTIGGKTALSVLPNPISAVINGIWDELKNNVFKKRYEEFGTMVVERLSKLEEPYEKLINDERFATTLLKTSKMAIETELKEKREILANALINTYTFKIAEDKTIIFLQLIEKYTILHIQIIKYFHDDYMNEKPFNNHMPPIMGLVRMRFSNIDSAYLNKVVKDLQNDYILEAFQYNSPVDIMHYRAKLLTKLGEDFFDYLKSSFAE